MTEPGSLSNNRRVTIGRLSVARVLYDFVNAELLPEAELQPPEFWRGLGDLVVGLAPLNRQLLQRRDQLQQRIDDWHRSQGGAGDDPAAYEEFLRSIGYLVPEPGNVRVTTSDVDPELSEIAGPQLVVPVLNARFALNAANARWGSLYDALYGSDMIDNSDGAAPGAGYNPVRGRRVIDFVRRFLDQSAPLARGSHAEVRCYRVEDGRLAADLSDGTTGLADPQQLAGFAGSASGPQQIVLSRHGLHVVIIIDGSTEVGRADPAGISDVRVEAAVTTIVDFEDSVAAVDAEDKVAAYRNWLELNRGSLTAPVIKNGVEFERSLNDDLRFTAAGGGELTLPGRALLLVRNVGHLMVSDAIVDSELGPVPEGILDAVMTTLGALPGLRADNPHANSRVGSVYIVKPKMHGPEEVAFSNRLFERVEDLLGLSRNMIKMGVMDEERRTSVNLAACLTAAPERIVFINTGFLDRTGDEIHTSMLAGPMVRKAEMKQQTWIKAYEDANVDVGLAAGLPTRGQIGKGMWAMPDLMADMYQQKIEHPRAGANTAWVPSPTAAALHALHYHSVDVRQRQADLVGRRRTGLEQLLTIPLALDPSAWSAADRQRELDSNAQSILGYVVRWIDQGVGCSKVPDIDDVALMEDRATLRISSQLLANWLHHRVITADEVRKSFERMAGIVDRQNAGDPGYRAMAADFDTNIAFSAALELVTEGINQPNGYTELILHRRRAEYKAANPAR